jgi:hypothetical protein
MQYKFTKTYSSAPESGGDDIARKSFLKDNWQLSQLDPELPYGPHSYPPKIFDTPEKAALSLHCMCAVMRNEPACMKGNVLKSLAADIENYSLSVPERRKEFIENIVIVAASIIETAEPDEELMLCEAMYILEDMKSMQELEGFVLPIHGARYHTVKNIYDKKQLK